MAKPHPSFYPPHTRFSSQSIKFYHPVGGPRGPHCGTAKELDYDRSAYILRFQKCAASLIDLFFWHTSEQSATRFIGLFVFRRLASFRQFLRSRISNIPFCYLLVLGGRLRFELGAETERAFYFREFIIRER